MKKSLPAKKRNTKGKKKSTHKKYPLRGKPVVTYREPFKPVDLDELPISPRVPGIDRGEVVIKPDFEDPLEEFEE